MTLFDWAARWGMPQLAIDELQQLISVDKLTSPSDLVSEVGASKRVRLNYAAAGALMYRNNVGACVDERGNHIRYGLANESRQMNKRIKSSDLIGIQPVIITQAMVGYKIGQFVAREVKKPGWHYTGNERERAQLKFIDLILSRGGDAAFTTGE